jgi:hypothetical protein
MDDYWDVKRLRIYFSSVFGQKKLNKKVFKDVPYGPPGISKYDIINLREGSDDNIVEGSPSSFYDNHIFLKNRWTHDTQLAMGHESARGNYVNVFLQGEYYGMFHMHEVNHSNWQAETYGGEKEDYNVMKYDGAINGSNTDWENVKSELTNGNYAYFKQRVDIENFIDYHLLEWYICNVDWVWNNQLIAGTNDPLDQYRNFVWDVDLAMFSSAIDPNWAGNDITDKFIENVDRFVLLAEDEFRVKLMDRIYKHFYRDGLLSPSKSVERLMLRKEEMEPGVYAHQQKNGYAYDWATSVDYTVNTWIPERYNMVTAQFLNADYYPETLPPDFNMWGGQVSTGFTVSLSNPNGSGDIYYTLDNTDPRDTAGVISPGAILYTSPFTLPSGVIQVWARVFDTTAPLPQDQWSAACPQRFYVSTSYADLVINEIMYHPDVLCESGDLDLDFIELLNNGSNPLDLSGVSFTKGIYYTFPYPTILSPGSFIVLAEDAGDFAAGYGFQADGQFSGRLDNGGEYIELSDPFSNILDSLSYGDSMPWDRYADGNGTSLELIDPDLDNSNPLFWLHSQQSCGTPGQPNSGYCTSVPEVVVINEIYYNADNQIFDPGDWIELYNPGSASIDLTNWEFRDEGHAWSLPAGTTISANGYLVLVQDDLQFTNSFPEAMNYVGNFGFGLSSNGERISMFNAQDCLVDLVPYNDAAPWPLEPDGNGPSLSLIQTNLDNIYYYNWESSTNINAPHGTPGRANVPCGLLNSFSNNPLTHIGAGSSSTTLNFTSIHYEASFTVSNLSQKLVGKESKKYIDLVTVSYIDGNGQNQIYGVYSGANVDSVNIEINDAVLSIIITLEDGYDGNTGTNVIDVSMNDVSSCGSSGCTDSDGDGVCAEDDCDDNDVNIGAIGSACDDEDVCTANDVYDLNCNCVGVFEDTDGDGVCDADDICPGGDDNIDSDSDGIPDFCDCDVVTSNFNPSMLDHSGTGSTFVDLLYSTNQTNVEFTVTELGAKTNGNPNNRYIDIVEIQYTDNNGVTQSYGTLSGQDQSSVSVLISDIISSVTVILSDGYDGNSPSISVNITAVASCEAGSSSLISPTQNELLNYSNFLDLKQTRERMEEQSSYSTNLSIFPNPTRDLLKYSFETKIGQDYKITINNILGITIHQMTFEGTGGLITEQVSAQEWQSGFYMFVLRYNNQIDLQPVIIH